MIRERVFGQTSDNETIKEYEIKDDGSSLRVMDYGAAITSICVPDRNNKLTEITLGFDTFQGYEESGSFIGATCGRYGNRIGNSCFELNGKRYSLYPNNGPHSLHGGKVGFNRKKWESYVEDNRVVMKYESVDMEEGYPGTLTVKAVFGFVNHELSLDYSVISDQDTVANIINHTYFNLNGHSSGDVLGHEVMLNADYYCQNDEYGMAIGEPVPVEGTPFDFRDWNTIGKRINDCEQLLLVKGYDHNYCVNKSKDNFVAAAKAPSGISLKVYSDLPGLQFYSGNNMVKEYGRGGHIYYMRSGVCFETQEYPNAINNPSFPSPVIKKGECKSFNTKYVFDVI